MTQKGPENELKPDFAQVMELTRQYGSIALIPDDQLTDIGYVRHGDGHIAPVELDVVPMDLRTGYMTLEEKDANKPFESFTITVDAKQTTKHLSQPMLDTMNELEQEIDNLLESSDFMKVGNNIGLTSPHATDEAMELLREEMVSYPMLSGSEETEFDGRRMFRNAGSWLIVEHYSTFIPEDIIDEGLSEIGVRHKRAPIQQRIPYVDVNELMHDPDELAEFDQNLNNLRRQKTVKFINDLLEETERERGRTTDLTELYKAWDHRLGFDRALDDKTESAFSGDAYDLLEGTDVSNEQLPVEAQKITDYIQSLMERGIDTDGKFILFMIGETLDKRFPGIQEESFVDGALQNNGSREALAWLQSLEPKLKANSKEQFKQAKRDLKTVPFDSPERSEVEARVQFAKKALGDVARQLDPIISIFQRPELVARTLNKKYDDIRRLFTVSEKSNIELSFVAGIDEELDANPGEVSGDCTTAEPLPFLAPMNRLYNVKVFRDSQDHVGNIYLLEVTDKYNQPMAWHLDAIQVPLYVDWDEASQKLVDGLKELADKRGVGAITINDDPHYISNYNYISDAFGKLTKKRISAEDDDGLAGRIVNAGIDTTPDARSVGRLQVSNSNFLRRLV